MFPELPEDGDLKGNVLPGTVVENRSDGQDVFLVPHLGLQGTVRPTHYVCLRDENGLSADEFQRLCNNLAYSYARSTTAVSMIPAVYYAGLAAARAKNHLGRDGNIQQTHKKLRNTMVSLFLSVACGILLTV